MSGRHTITEGAEGLGALCAMRILLVHQLALVLSHITGLPRVAATAILLSSESLRTQLDVVKNVAIVQPYQDLHLVHLGRVLAKIARVDEEIRNYTNTQVYLSHAEGTATFPGGLSSGGMDRQLDQLQRDITAVSAETSQLLEKLPRWTQR